MTTRKTAHSARASRARAPKQEADVRTRVFVYGTLLSGERNHRYLVHARLIAEARTQPAFTLHDLGGFPGLVSGGDHAVVGEVYEVDEPTLAAMDRLESHPDFYRRTSIVLEDGSAVEAYLLPPEQVSDRPIIASGSWRARDKATRP